MQRLTHTCLVLACVWLAGCSESALVRSSPSNAKLYVNDNLVGVTPTVYKIPHSKIGDEFRIRLEREDYMPQEDVLRKHICAGRIVGGVFTLGISLLIRGPTCLVSPQDFMLDPLAGNGVTPEGGAGAAPPTVEDRLRRLQKMRDEGTINQQEYEQYRTQILKGL